MSSSQVITSYCQRSYLYSRRKLISFTGFIKQIQIRKHTLHTLDISGMDNKYDSTMLNTYDTLFALLQSFTTYLLLLLRTCGVLLLLLVREALLSRKVWFPTVIHYANLPLRYPCAHPRRRNHN